MKMTRPKVLGGVTFVLAAILGACSEREQPGLGKAVWVDTEPIEVVKGRAHRGPWRMNTSAFDYVDDPTVAIADDGHIAVAWADQARRDVLLQIYAPGGGVRFLEPVNLSSSPATFSWLPRLVIANDPRRIYALWQEIIFSGGSHGGEIIFARSMDGGRTFGPAINLSNSMAGDGKGRLTAERWDNGSLDLAAGPNGHLHATWTEYEGRLWVSSSADAGATFTKPIHVAGDMDRPARAPALVVGSDGIVHLAWSASGKREAGKIHLASSANGGRTFGGRQTIVSNGHADAPKLAADAQGRLHLVYGESPDGPFRQYRIRYTRRDAHVGSFSPPRTIAAADVMADSLHFPEIAIDPAGRLYVVWMLFPDRQQRAHGLGFTISRDGGRTFARPMIVPKSDDARLGFGGSLQGSLTRRLVVNQNGTLALVNSTFAPERSSLIRLWRWSVAE